MNRPKISRLPWTAMMLFLLVGTLCVVAQTERPKPRDMSPVTWEDAPAHPPVEVVRAGASSQ